MPTENFLQTIITTNKKYKNIHLWQCFKCTPYVGNKYTKTSILDE